MPSAPPDGLRLPRQQTLWRLQRFVRPARHGQYAGATAAEEEENFWQDEDDDIGLSPRPAAELYRQVMAYSGEAPLPAGWEKVPSRSRPNEFSYQDMQTGKRVKIRPTEPAAATRSPAQTFAPATKQIAPAPAEAASEVAAPRAEPRSGVPKAGATPNPIVADDPKPGADPFVKDFKFAPPRESAPRKRELYFYVQILSFGNIKNDEQTFDAYFYLKAAWSEPEIEKEIGDVSGQMAAFNYEADPIKWPKGLFDPKLDFMNSTGSDVTITKPKLEISPWRTGLNKAPVVEYSFFGRGTFIESLELQNFPFDVQPLRISISTSLPLKCVDLLEDQYIKVKSTLRSDFLVNPEFHIPTKLIVNEGEPITQPILVKDHTSFKTAQGVPVPILHVAVIAKRIPDYYVWNVFFLMFLIVCMEGGAFVALDPSEVGDRFSVTLTLTLVAVAYKYVVADYLPHLSYFTLCDKYIMASFIFLALALLQNTSDGYFSIQAEEESATPDDDDDVQKRAKNFSKNFSSVTEWLMAACFLVYNVYFVYRCRVVWNKTKSELHDRKQAMKMANQPRGDENQPDENHGRGV